jgi:hypothetical protein
VKVYKQFGEISKEFNQRKDKNKNKKYKWMILGEY